MAELMAGPYTGLLVNFRNKHVSVSPYLRSCLNGECSSAGYLDISRYAESWRADEDHAVNKSPAPLKLNFNFICCRR